MNYPKEFENLIDAFRRLPGIGYKSAERMAYQILEMKEEYRDQFVEALNGVSLLKKCKICHNLSSSDRCEICDDPTRDESVICVVQNIKDVYACGDVILKQVYQLVTASSEGVIVANSIIHNNKNTYED